MDISVSVAQFVEYRFPGNLDAARVEVTAILELGRIVPSIRLAMTRAGLVASERVILEVNCGSLERSRACRK